MDKWLLKKFDNSVDLESKTIYLSNRRIIDFDGNIIGFFDTNDSIGEYTSTIGVGQETCYLGPDDFESMCDFKEKLNQYLKEKNC